MSTPDHATGSDQPAGAYWIARVRITDPERYRGYMALAPAAFAAYGGRFVVRGGDPMTVEGEAPPERVAIIAFDSVATALACHDSPEYRAARAAREGAAEVEIVIVKGSEP
jgi:uncharacterized protein (DUF1330 family)